jgi:hypothetical protein
MVSQIEAATAEIANVRWARRAARTVSDILDVLKGYSAEALP